MSQDRFDGLTVDVHRGRFTGAFEVDMADATYLPLDAEVMFVVVARVKGATVTETATGDVKRTNSLAVKEVAVVRQGGLRSQLAGTLGLTEPNVFLSPPTPASLDAVAETSVEREVEERVPTPVGARTAPAISTSDPLLRRFLEEA